MDRSTCWRPRRTWRRAGWRWCRPGEVWPASTPSFDAATGYLYTMSTDGDLQCWDTARGGRRVWKLNLYDAYKAPQRPSVGGGRRDYGYPGAALIWRDWLIVEVGAREAGRPAGL